MPFRPGPVCLRSPHQDAPPWPTEILTYEEAERHLRRLTRMGGCGCMRYSGFTTRPTTRVQLADGATRHTSVGRLMALLSGDRPLGPDDFACHRCDNEVCANPDHILIGTASSNGLDKHRPGRPIRERMAARWFDPILAQIPQEPPGVILPRKQGRPIGYHPSHERPRFAFALPAGLIGAASAPSSVGGRGPCPGS